MRFSSYHSSWDRGMFSEKYNDNWQILTFDDLWWPQYCSKVKNDRNTFKRTHWGLSTAFYRVFLSLLVFELEVGGNICPPSLGRSWLRPPLGRGLNKVHGFAQLTLFLAGSAGTRNWRGGPIRPPSDLKTTHCSDKRQTAFDRAFKDLQLLQKTFSGQVNIEVTRGHQR